MQEKVKGGKIFLENVLIQFDSSMGHMVGGCLWM